MGSGSSCLGSKPPPSHSKIIPSLDETIQTTTTISLPSSHQQNDDICDIETGHISDDNDIQMSNETSDEDVDIQKSEEMSNETSDEDGIQLSHLTDDIIVDIFSTLPARPLIRCKSISHKFYQLFHEEFLRRTLIKPSPFSGFFYTKHITPIQTTLIYFPIPTLSQPTLNTDFLPTTEAILIGGTNGLLLFTYGRVVALHCNVYVCDPVTRDFTVIPPPLPPEDTILRSGVVAYDPAVDPTSFKVVLFFASRPIFMTLDETYIMVFSSTTRMWSRTTLPYHCCSHQAIYHRGTVLAHANGRASILNLDVQNELLRKDTRLPKFFYSTDSCMGVLRDRFAVVYTTATSFNVFTLEDGQLDSGWRAEWTHIYSITGAVNPRFFTPFSFHPNQDVVFFQDRDYLVHAFHLGEDTMVELGKMECMCPYNIHPFTHYPLAHLALH